MAANERGHYAIEPLGVELGLWRGSYQNQTQLWLRWWDSQGNLLLTGREQTEIERARTERERQRADIAEQKLEAEARKRVDAIGRLFAKGLDAEEVAEILGMTVEEVRQYAP
ncbi:MAG: hypothetical protein F6J93_17935 [Oscillatoria sp. SIO1A7]|nr:hypothetical protein [Oscillatoria sp. SIO1A7]